jgi:cell wall-associated NlpC family hydrolase
MRKASIALMFAVLIVFPSIRLRANETSRTDLDRPKAKVEFRKSSASDSDSTPSNHSSKKKHRSSQKKGDAETKSSATPTPSAEEKDKSNGSNDQNGQSAADKARAENKPTATSVASLQPADLREFDSQPEKVQNLIRSALALTERNLGYTYGSADPNNGGMDCSGFIYYVLTAAGYQDAPRQSSDQYLWVRKNSDFHAVISRSSDTFELKQLRPGDLMFWSGTYEVNRDVPITHVMIYLGTEKKTKKPVMVGASDGRTYQGERRFGVSVFDFKLPNGTPNKNDPDLIARFEGYASIPGIGAGQSVADSPSTPTPSPAPRRVKLAEKDKPLSNGD